jgi:hypothetical protein
MLQEYVLNVLVLCCSKCFHVANCKCLSRSCICCTGYIRMFEVYVSNILAVFRSMLQVFYLDFAYTAVVIHICYAYVSNISSISYICCSKSFMLQVFSFAGTGSRGNPRGHAQQHGMCRQRIWVRAAGGAGSSNQGSMRRRTAVDACERVKQVGQAAAVCASVRQVQASGLGLTSGHSDARNAVLNMFL